MVKDSMRTALRVARSIGTFWIADQTTVHLKNIRLHEVEIACQLLPPHGTLLEIGAGSGWQAKALSDRGYDVSAIDIETSNYKDLQTWPVIDYDGHKLPFDDATFDIVFSSNALEHIPHVEAFQAEIRRVMKPGGVAVHILPSATWRFWTCLTEITKNWRPPIRHGEHASNAVTEIRYFGRSWWRDLFERTGWTVESCRSNELFYTGCSIMDDRLQIGARRSLSRVLGGSCNIFLLTT